MATSYAEQGNDILYPRETIFYLQSQNPNISDSIISIKKPGHYTRYDWRRIIDSLWGPGLPTNTKLQIFDQFWTLIDSNFACFNNLTVNWDSLRILYRTEIEDTVSRGRFAAIMNYLGLALKESHTKAEDMLVNWNTSLTPGVPLFVIGGWYNNGHFGAGLTPLPDSSLLVYQTIANHPLGLNRGDIILGYDRIPWKVLYKQLLVDQLPVKNFGWGSSDSTLTHSLLMSAGMNWHCFDTIDVAKYPTWDTVHLSVAPLIGQSMSLFCTEQMDIPGVLKPNLGSNQAVSYGIVSGTQIGYIYVWVWNSSYNAENGFYDALYNLTNNPSLKGIIIDFRFNMGGNMFLSNKGLELLFRDTTKTICWSMRDNPHNHFSMFVAIGDWYSAIPGNGIGYYKPIAVLTGPGAVSSGDQVAFRMKFHPTTKLFGKSTATAFNSAVIDSLHPDWLVTHAAFEACLASDTLYYLTHRELAVDFPVWLTPWSVAQGEDDVVKAAIAWIDTMGVNETEKNTRFSGIKSLQIYPNPIKDVATFELILSNPNIVSIRIYNILGQEVTTILSEKAETGNYLYHWNPRQIPNGIYFCRMTVGDEEQTIKMTIIK